MADFLPSSFLQAQPTMAGLFQGQKQATDQEEAKQKNLQLMQILSDLQQKHAFNDKNNPLLLEHQSLQNQGLQAGLGGIWADSDLKRTTASKAAGTLSTDIAAGNSTNLEKIDENDAKKQARISKAFIEMGPMLEQVPTVGGQRTLAAKQMLKTMGMDENDPKAGPMLQIIAATPPEQLPQVLAAMGKKMAEQSPKYIEEMAKTNAQVQGHKDVAHIQNAGRLALEQQQYEHGKYDPKTTAVTVEAQLLKASTSKAKAEILEQAYSVANEAGDTKKAEAYAKRAVEARLRAAEDARNNGLAKPGIDVPGMAGVPAQAAPAATAPIAGNGAVSNNATPPASQAQRVKIVGPDGKPYTVPAEQVQEALKQGYKLRGQ